LLEIDKSHGIAELQNARRQFFADLRDLCRDRDDIPLFTSAMPSFTSGLPSPACG
jgi:hypothetical protein